MRVSKLLSPVFVIALLAAPAIQAATAQAKSSKISPDQKSCSDIESRIFRLSKIWTVLGDRWVWVSNEAIRRDDPGFKDRSLQILKQAGESAEDLAKFEAAFSNNEPLLMSNLVLVEIGQRDTKSVFAFLKGRWTFLRAGEGYVCRTGPVECIAYGEESKPLAAPEKKRALLAFRQRFDLSQLEAFCSDIANGIDKVFQGYAAKVAKCSANQSEAPTWNTLEQQCDSVAQALKEITAAK